MECNFQKEVKPIFSKAHSTLSFQDQNYRAIKSEFDFQVMHVCEMILDDLLKHFHTLKF